jgi:hypothetical protein
MYLLPILSIDSYVCVPATGRTASSLVIVLTAQRLSSLSRSRRALFVKGRLDLRTEVCPIDLIRKDPGGA